MRLRRGELSSAANAAPQHSGTWLDTSRSTSSATSCEVRRAFMASDSRRSCRRMELVPAESARFAASGCFVMFRQSPECRQQWTATVRNDSPRQQAGDPTSHSWVVLSSEQDWRDQDWHSNCAMRICQKEYASAGYSFGKIPGWGGAASLQLPSESAGRHGEQGV